MNAVRITARTYPHQFKYINEAAGLKTENITE